MAPDDQLEALARARFPDPPLTAAETKLVRAAPKGEFAVCGPNTDDDDPLNDPSKADKDWKGERQIRAALIRWLCVDKQAKELIDPKGIQIYGATLSDELDIANAVIPFPIRVRRSLLTANASLFDLTIPRLDFQGTWARSIWAERIKVAGSVLLRNGFHANGTVRLLNAEIGSDLDCSGAQFVNPTQKDKQGTGIALSADRIDVRGGVFLNTGFRSEGEVRLLGAHIGGDLECGGGRFSNPAQKALANSGDALIVERAEIQGALFLTEDFGIEGRLLLGAASVGSLVDELESWPAPRALALDGFTYKRITSDTRDAKNRLDWLSRMQEFAPQPYRQLAKVMREEGDDRGARKVLHEMERLRRKNEDKTWYWRGWSWIFGKTIGYGYYPGYSLIWLLALVGFGWLLFSRGYYAGNMVPTDKDAYWTFALENQPPSHYEHFHALSYSLENSFPLLKLGQSDRWQPEPKRSFSPHFLVSPTFLRCFRWVQIVLGWILATFFVVGLTGILQKDKD